jgi:hypothetical protein
MSGNDERIQIDFCPLCKNPVRGWSLRNEQNNLIGILDFNRGIDPLLIMPDVDLINALNAVFCYVCHMTVRDTYFILQIKNKIRKYMKGDNGFERE